MIVARSSTKEIEKLLWRGGIGVIPTDTMYGLVGRALSKRAVARIYRVRRRNQKKPCIVLVGSVAALRRFGVRLSARERGLMRRMWPGPVSVIVRCPHKKFSYLHRGTHTLAFRYPDKKDLARLLRRVGPLAAPSANLEGSPPAKTIRDAMRYFGDAVDFYVDRGRISGKPSTLIRFERSRIVFVRRGAGLTPRVEKIIRAYGTSA